MSTVPTDRKYLVSHEWHRTVGNVVEIGITQFAADELTDVTYVKLPKVGEKLEKGKTFGEIESVKATSDLYSGVTGTVTEVNEALQNDPGLVNREPYTTGWMIKVQPVDGSSMSDTLLTTEAYLKATGHA